MGVQKRKIAELIKTEPELVRSMFRSTRLHNVRKWQADRPFERLLRELAREFEMEEFTRAEVLETLMNIMASSDRNEIVFKSVLVSGLLQKSTFLSGVRLEKPIASSIADVMVYRTLPELLEIKTPHDNSDKLPKQLNDYFRFCPWVTLVIDSKELNKYEKYLDEYPIGLATVGPRLGFRYLRKPTVHVERIDVSVISSSISIKNKRKYIERYATGVAADTFSSVVACKIEEDYEKLYKNISNIEREEREEFSELIACMVPRNILFMVIPAVRTVNEIVRISDWMKESVTCITRI